MTATNRRKLTPPQLAKLWGIDSDKIRGWILTGQLRAINVATEIGGKPRWLIDIDDIADFERRRAAVEPAKPKKTRQPFPKASKRYF